MIDEVRASAAKKILFLPHSISQMSRPDRMISVEDVEVTILSGEVIEEYADDPRGRSCLMSIFLQGARFTLSVRLNKITWPSLQLTYHIRNSGTASSGKGKINEMYVLSGCHAKSSCAVHD